MVIGVDEVGRGAWAGPLVVGAVALDSTTLISKDGPWIQEIKDSKLLSKAMREKLDILIRQSAVFVGLGWVGVSELDKLGLTGAMTLACTRALKGCPQDTSIIIDGSINFLPENPHASCLIDGDDKLPAISAASIVAKVARDQYMSKLEVDYVGYGFDKHVGYGTVRHKSAIDRLGITPLHRRSFKSIKAYT